jgi:hypothetical protein
MFNWMPLSYAVSLQLLLFFTDIFLHFLSFPKPAAHLKKPLVAPAQKKIQESESSDSDSDDESDDVIYL